MVIIKLWYHVIAFFQRLFYQFLYGQRLRIGKSVTWRRGMTIMIARKGKIEIGDSCFFNNNCTLDSNLLITIGDGCLFGENVKVYDHNHKFSEKKPIKEQGYSDGKVFIGEHCWVGSGVIILKDTYIGNNCVIGAGCVISGEIPDNTLLKCDISYYTENIKDMEHIE